MRVELKKGYEVLAAELLAKITDALKESDEMLRLNVEEAPAGALPRFELTARRVVVKRNRP